MSICAGIDVGSTYTKAVLLKDGKTELARAVHKTRSTTSSPRDSDATSWSSATSR